MIQRQKLVSCVITLCIVMILLSAATAGNIEYPALGNMELDEGTIEVWLTPMAELYPDDPGRFRGAFSVFSLSVPDAFSMSCAWGSSSGKHGVSHRLYVSMGAAGVPRGLLPVPSTPKGVERGKPVHIAFSWKGPEMILWVDGSRVGHRSQSMAFPGRLGDVPLFIGNSKARSNDIIVHAVRLSSVARTETMLAGAEPCADIYTLLLDRFIRPDSGNGTTTTPEVMSNMGGRMAGTCNGTVRYVKTPAAGLALYPATEE